MSARRCSRLTTRAKPRGEPGRGSRPSRSVPRPPPPPRPPPASGGRTCCRRGLAPDPRTAAEGAGRRVGWPLAARTRGPVPARGGAPPGGRRGSGRGAGDPGSRPAPPRPHALDLCAQPLELGIVGEALEQVLPHGHRVPRPPGLHERDPLVEERLLVVGRLLQRLLELR